MKSTDRWFKVRVRASDPKGSYVHEEGVWAPNANVAIAYVVYRRQFVVINDVEVEEQP